MYMQQSHTDANPTPAPTHGRCPHIDINAGATDRADDLTTKAHTRFDPKVVGSPAARTGVLLVNHGSHSETWRGMLLDIHKAVSDELLLIPEIGAIRTAFMEYTEPSIATQLKAFDREGYTRIIVIPLLLTVSNHSSDDIPAICGLSHDPACIEQLRKEKIEIYKPRAELLMAPLLDFPGVARLNLARRLRSLVPGGIKARDGLVLVGYGSEEFDDHWTTFFEGLGRYACQQLGFTFTAHAWCGHLVGYKPGPTAEAIKRTLDIAERVAVVPVLVAYDEMFQDRIIGAAVHQAGQSDRVHYRPDSILPEPAVERWIISAVEQSLQGSLPSALSGA